MVVAVAYYLAAVMMAFALVTGARAVSEGERALSRLDSAEERTDTLLKGWMETLSLGLYEGASEKARTREELEQRALARRRDVTVLSIGLAGASAAFLLLVWLSLAERDLARRPRLLLHLHGVAGICLVVGLLAPMLSVVARSDVAVLGRVVLQFQSKGILDTVAALLAGGNAFTGVLLGLFSVVVPIAKLGLSLCALLARPGTLREGCLALVRAVGKWSMTDVFVVAVLLAFLALGDGAFTDARLGPGLYFFAAYGLLSFVGSIGLARYRSEPPA
jgi:hypothetical protein